MNVRPRAVRRGHPAVARTHASTRPRRPLSRGPLGCRRCRKASDVPCPPRRRSDHTNANATGQTVSPRCMRRRTDFVSPRPAPLLERTGPLRFLARHSALPRGTSTSRPNAKQLTPGGLRAMPASVAGASLTVCGGCVTAVRRRTLVIERSSPSLWRASSPAGSRRRGERDERGRRRPASRRTPNRLDSRRPRLLTPTRTACSTALRVRPSRHRTGAEHHPNIYPDPPPSPTKPAGIVGFNTQPPTPNPARIPAVDVLHLCTTVSGPSSLYAHHCARCSPSGSSRPARRRPGWNCRPATTATRTRPSDLWYLNYMIHNLTPKRSSCRHLLRSTSSSTSPKARTIKDSTRSGSTSRTERSYPGFRLAQGSGPTGSQHLPPTTTLTRGASTRTNPIPPRRGAGEDVRSPAPRRPLTTRSR